MDVPAIRLWPDSTGQMEGSRLCLAFANTAWWRRGGEPVDSLTDYEALIAAVGADLDEADRRALRDAADAEPAAAARALTRAVTLRESIYALFLRVASGDGPEPADMAELDRWAVKSLAQVHLVMDSAAGDGARVAWRHPHDLDRPAWQVALSAAALLTGGPLERLKACPGPRCGWLFIDTTRNDSRRWCSPAHCGNRERVKAHYRRTHGTSARSRDHPG